MTASTRSASLFLMASVLTAIPLRLIPFPLEPSYIRSVPVHDCSDMSEDGCALTANCVWIANPPTPAKASPQSTYTPAMTLPATTVAHLDPAWFKLFARSKSACVSRYSTGKGIYRLEDVIPGDLTLSCHFHNYTEGAPSALAMWTQGRSVCQIAHFCFTLAIREPGGTSTGSQGCLSAELFLRLYGDNTAVRDAPGCYNWLAESYEMTVCFCQDSECNTADAWAV